MFPQNFAEFGNFRAHSVDLCCYLIDLRIIYQLTNRQTCTKIDRLLLSLLIVLTYGHGTICTVVVQSVSCAVSRFYT